MDTADLDSFISLIPSPNASWGNAVPMTQASVENLFSFLALNPAFLVNMLGRPDYWAPQKRWEKATDGTISACGKTRNLVWRETSRFG